MSCPSFLEVQTTIRKGFSYWHEKETLAQKDYIGLDQDHKYRTEYWNLTSYALYIHKYGRLGCSWLITYDIIYQFIYISQIQNLEPFPIHNKESERERVKKIYKNSCLFPTFHAIIAPKFPKLITYCPLRSSYN